MKARTRALLNCNLKLDDIWLLNFYSFDHLNWDKVQDFADYTKFKNKKSGQVVSLRR